MNWREAVETANRMRFTSLPHLTPEGRVALARALYEKSRRSSLPTIEQPETDREGQ